MISTLIAVAIGLVVGLVIGALGGGGGVLTVPALVYLLHVPTREAAAASLVIVGTAALVGLPAHARSGNVRWPAGLAFGAVGTAAAIGGTLLSRQLDGDVLLLAFAVIILVSATLMLRDAIATRRRSAGAEPPPPATAPPAPVSPGRPTGNTTTAAVLERSTRETADSGPGRSRALQATMIVLGGLAVGLMTGLFGVGGGFLAVPVLVLVMRWPIASAVGTSLLIIVINSAASLASRASVDTFDWHIIVPVTAAAVVGTLLGKLITDRVSGPRLTGSFAGMLVALAAYTGVRSVLGLLD